MINSSKPENTRQPRVCVESPVIVSDIDQTERSSKKRKFSEETKSMEKDHSGSMPMLTHYLANQTLYGLLQRFNLPLHFVDDPIFQQFLLAVRFAGQDYRPTATTVTEDNLLVIALSAPETLLSSSTKKH